MNILVIGQGTLHWGRLEFGNIGNYYIIEPFFRELHRVFPQATIRTTFQMTVEFQKRENVSSVPMSLYYAWNDMDLPTAYKEYTIASIYKETGALIDTTPYIEELRRTDLLIDFSGDIWGQNADFVGPNRFLIGLLKDRSAQLLGIPTAMIAGSPGPFNRDATLEFAKLVFEKFDLVTNREEISKKVLDDFGFDTGKVHSLACPAFEFEPASNGEIAPFLEGSPLERKIRPVVGFILCGWNLLKGPYSRTDWEEGEFKNYTDLLRMMVKKYNVDVCLMSHSNGFIVPPAEFKLIKGRDYPMAKEIYTLLKNSEVSDHVYLFDGIYTPAETKGIIGHFDMLISGRVHAAVAALSQSVPTMIIDYGHEPKAHKLRGFARVANVEQYVADPHLYKELQEKAVEVYEHRHEIKNMLVKRNVEITRMLKLNFDLLKTIVKANKD